MLLFGLGLNRDSNHAVMVILFLTFGSAAFNFQCPVRSIF